jgi:predicted GNAT family N-acyltransferase
MVISVRPAVNAQDRAAALRIRYVVFVEEQGVPVELERDDRDADADHVLAERDGLPVGAGRLVIEAPGWEGLDEGLGPIGHLGRLAVLVAARGSGVGAELVRAIEGRAAGRGLRAVYLGAQTHAVAFYERLGYSAFGAEFDDAGLPHRHMWRRLGGQPPTDS